MQVAHTQDGVVKKPSWADLTKRHNELRAEATQKGLENIELSRNIRSSMRETNLGADNSWKEITDRKTELKDAIFKKILEEIEISRDTRNSMRETNLGADKNGIGYGSIQNSIFDK